MARIVDDEKIVRARAVALILAGRPEEALDLLSRYYGVEAPRLRVGLPAGCRGRALGCYVAREKTIYVRSRREYMDPFVVLHEYYHHLRTRYGRHRGTEKHANRYAADSIHYYRVYCLGGDACSLSE